MRLPRGARGFRGAFGSAFSGGFGGGGGFTDYLTDLAAWYAPTWSIAAGKVLSTPTLGGELLTNGNMEAGSPPSNWVANTATLAGSGVAHGGAQSLSVTATGNYGEGMQNVSLSTGKWYVASAWSRIVSGMGQFKFNFGTTDIGLPGHTNTVYGLKVITARATGTPGFPRLLSVNIGDVVLYDDASVQQETNLLATRLVSLADYNLSSPPISTLVTGTQAGIVFSLDSQINPKYFGLAYCDGVGHVNVDKCVNGTYTPLTPATVAWNAGKHFSLRKNGTSHIIYYDAADYSGTPIGTYTISDVGNGSYCGLFSTYLGNLFAPSSTSPFRVTNYA